MPQKGSEQEMGFGIHEALDQVGAFIGPLIFTTSLALTGGFKQGFTVMWVPAILTVSIAFSSDIKYPNLKCLKKACRYKITSQVPRIFPENILDIRCIYLCQCFGACKFSDNLIQLTISKGHSRSTNSNLIRYCNGN